MPTGSGPISPTPQNNCNGADRKSLDNNTNNSGHSNGGSKLSTMSQDHTLYVQRARVTRPAPPKPSANPMQFVQIKPCNLYQSAQEQLKRADEVKKVKEIKKEEPEDWQCNLDNWKSSRRKRVEHIIDRVVEVKKLELEEHDRTRRKSKTFSEMMEEKKGSRRPTKLAALPVYTEDESNDLSDFGIGTSSASGKSSLSEDYDNQSVMSDNIDNDKQSIDLDNNSNHENGGASRDYISSPGYDTSSSTAPASSPDPCEYTYEGAIEDYKTRISKTQTINYNNGFRHNSSAGLYSKDSTPERSTVGSSESAIHHSRRMSGSKIEDRLMSFEIKSASDLQHETAVTKSLKKDLPKVDILKRRELFEKENGLHVVADQTTTAVCSVLIGQKRGDSNDFSNSKSIKERLSNLEKTKPAAALIDDTKKASNRLSGDISSIKDRLQILEKQNSQAEKSLKIEVPVVSLKDRLTSLHSAVAKEEVKKPVLLIDEHQLEMLKQEELVKQKEQRQQQLMSSLKEDTTTTDDENLHSSHEILNIQDESNVDTDREDSGIHTTDVSCSVSQTDEQPDLSNEESHHHINVDGLCPTHEDAALDATPIIIPDVVPAEIDSPALRVDDIIISHDTIEDASLSSITSPEPSNDLDASVNEALELALQAIDSESSVSDHSPIDRKSNMDTAISKSTEPIYGNIGESITGNLPITKTRNSVPPPQLPSAPVPVLVEKSSSDPEDDQEPYYQVPKSSEPYYEVPRYQKPVPVYENIEIFYPGPGSGPTPLTPEHYPLGNSLMEPPKEKPPPPPIDDLSDNDESEHQDDDHLIRKPSLPKQKPPLSVAVPITDQPMKRMNSTKRIKKELRNKRSSFLGIEGTNDDETYLELTVAPPPDMAQLLQEEKRLEKQLYMKAGLYDSSDTGDSRDSGVSENHSRQSSEPFTNSSEEHEDLLIKKEKEIIEVLEIEEEKQRKAENQKSPEESDAKIRCIEDQIREQEEVLRVERELLQLEQEELKRQRENLILRENLARHELEHGAKMLMSANRRSMTDINSTTATNVGHYANIPNQIYQIETDYRKSMSDLHDYGPKRMQSVPPIPPAKPMRSHIIVDSRQSSGLVKIASPTRVVHHSQSIDELAPLRNYQTNSALHPGNMSRHTLHALSATPKPKFTDGWIQSKNGNPDRMNNNTWLSYQEKRRSVPEGFNYNKHWLIQEAEQRRIEQQRGVRSSSSSSSNSLTNGWSSSSTTTPTKSAIQRNGSYDNKPLPDAIIQTLTQRVQSKGIGERKRFDPIQNDPISSATSLISVSTPQLNTTQNIPDGPADKILSVSGKKKCSHCGEELGRGAAMIIESLRLFYHIDCFKCCVCHVQLSDGLNGTDVRVRNHKLHCHNCYSSDDGIKFSCV